MFLLEDNEYWVCIGEVIALLALIAIKIEPSISIFGERRQ